MNTRELKFLVLIIVIFIAACIETDIYLPAFADMMHYFKTSEGAIQNLLTWNFIGICISCPFYGPISDSFGRKIPLMAALGIFLMGSIITVFAEQFDWMLWGRVLQGLGSGGCFTLGTAIIFDVFQEKKAVQALNQINSIVPFIMAAAPLIGGALNTLFGFRSNFMAIAGCVLLSLMITLFFFKETLDKSKFKPFEIRKILHDFQRACTCIPFWQMILIVSLIFAGYLAFLSGISILFIVEYGISKTSLPYYQAAILGAWVMASMTGTKAIHRFGIAKIKWVGTSLIVLGGLEFVIASLTLPENTIALTAGMLFYAFGANWVQTLYFPEGMELLPDIKGVTSGLLSSARLLITAAVVGLASQLYDGTIYPITGMIVGIVAIIIPTIILYEKGKGNSPATHQGVNAFH